MNQQPKLLEQQNSIGCVWQRTPAGGGVVLHCCSTVEVQQTGMDGMDDCCQSWETD